MVYGQKLKSTPPGTNIPACISIAGADSLDAVGHGIPVAFTVTAGVACEIFK